MKPTSLILTICLLHFSLTLIIFMMVQNRLSINNVQMPDVTQNTPNFSSQIMIAGHANRMKIIGNKFHKATNLQEVQLYGYFMEKHSGFYETFMINFFGFRENTLVEMANIIEKLDKFDKYVNLDDAVKKISHTIELENIASNYNSPNIMDMKMCITNSSTPSEFTNEFTFLISGTTEMPRHLTKQNRTLPMQNKVLTNYFRFFGKRDSLWLDMIVYKLKKLQNFVEKTESIFCGSSLLFVHDMKPNHSNVLNNGKNLQVFLTDFSSILPNDGTNNGTNSANNRIDLIGLNNIILTLETVLKNIGDLDGKIVVKKYNSSANVTNSTSGSTLDSKPESECDAPTNPTEQPALYPVSVRYRRKSLINPEGPVLNPKNNKKKQ